MILGGRPPGKVRRCRNGEANIAVYKKLTSNEVSFFRMLYCFASSHNIVRFFVILLGKGFAGIFVVAPFSEKSLIFREP